MDKIRIYDVQAQNENGEQCRIIADALTTALDQLDPRFADFTHIIIHSYMTTRRRWEYCKAYGITNVGVFNV